MSYKFTFREITPEDTEVLRMVALRKIKQKITSAAMLPMRMV